jgi:hypothetical protein
MQKRFKQIETVAVVDAITGGPLIFVHALSEGGQVWRKKGGHPWECITEEVHFDKHEEDL